MHVATQSWVQVQQGPKPQVWVFLFFEVLAKLPMTLKIGWWWLQEPKLGLKSKKDLSPSSFFLAFFLTPWRPTSSIESSLTMVAKTQAWAQVFFRLEPKLKFFFLLFFELLVELLSTWKVTWWWLQELELGLGSFLNSNPRSKYFIGFLFFGLLIELLLVMKVIKWWL